MNKLLLAIGLLFSASAFAQQSTNTAKIQFTGKYDSYIQNIFAFCSGPKPCKNCHPLVEKYEELCEKDQNQAKNKLLGSQALQGFGIDKPVQSQQQYNQISQNKPPPPPPVPYTPIVAINSNLMWSSQLIKEGGPIGYGGGYGKPPEDFNINQFRLPRFEGETIKYYDVTLVPQYRTTCLKCQPSYVQDTSRYKLYRQFFDSKGNPVNEWIIDSHYFYKLYEAKGVKKII